MTVRVSYIKGKKIISEKELAQGKMILGREGDLDIICGEQGISREHGEVTIFENHLLYKDLGSTNGSWVDGRKVAKDENVIAAFPCFLQLADVILGFSQDAESYLDDVFGSIAVFRNNVFNQALPLNKLGKSLVLGGIDSFIPFNEAKALDRPALVLEMRQGNLVCYSLSEEFPIYINGQEAKGKAQVESQDKITISDVDIYVVFFKESVVIKDRSTDAQTKQERRVKMLEEAIPMLKSWDDEDFDASGIFDKKGRIDGFQKLEPIMSEEFLRQSYEKKRQLNYDYIEKFVFYVMAGISILIIIALFIVINLKK